MALSLVTQGEDDDGGGQGLVIRAKQKVSEELFYKKDETQTRKC